MKDQSTQLIPITDEDRRFAKFCDMLRNSTAGRIRIEKCIIGATREEVQQLKNQIIELQNSLAANQSQTNSNTEKINMLQDSVRQIMKYLDGTKSIPQKPNKRLVVLFAVTLIAIALAIILPLTLLRSCDGEPNYGDPDDRPVPHELFVFDTKEDGGYIVSGSADSKVDASDELIIPDTYNGQPVVEIKESGFKDFVGIKSVVIPATVTTIGDGAFSGCSKLNDITISEGVKEIGNEAFLGTIPTILTIPSSVEYIGVRAFGDCNVNKVIFLDREGAVLPDEWQRDWLIADNVKLEYQYHIHLDYNSATGENTQKNVLATYNENYTLPVPIRVGYTFDGWYNGQEQLTNTDGTSIAQCTYTQSITACAKWTANINTVTFHANGGSGEMEQQRIATGTQTELIKRSFYKNEAVFSGWATSADGEVVYRDCASYTMGTSINYDLYAVWQAATPLDLFELSVANNEIEITKYKGEDDSVIIPEYINDNLVTSIGDDAFYDCISLTSITIPDSVTSIESSAFSDRSNLTRLNYTGDIADWCGISGLGDFLCYFLDRIDVYIGDIKLHDMTSITIPDGVTSIGDGALSSCSSLMSITIPNSVTCIGYYAFYNCSSLTSIMIPDGVTNIGYGAFSDCSSLTSITIPNGVTSIGNLTFYNCRSLTSVTIPNSVTSIGIGAFSGCSSLQYNEYDNAYYLGNDTNKYVALIREKGGSIASCTIHENTKVITDSAFSDCRSLTSVTIPNSVTSIGNYAFSDCISLTSITIPNSVTSIGDSAFFRCSRLQYNEYDNAYYLGNDTNRYVALIRAKGRSIASCTIHENTKFIYEEAFYNCSSLTSITIPNSVTSMGGGVFYGCSQLQSVTLSNQLMELPTYKNNYEAGYYGFFENCRSLTSIIIPNNLTSIGLRAFSGCGSLTSIAIPNGVTSIGDLAFYNCRSLTSVTIPNSVTSIGDSAFSDCRSLTSVTIPNSVTSIGNWAFSDCSSLTSITFNGTKAQWEKIEKGNKWDLEIGRYTIHCSDGSFSQESSTSSSSNLPVIPAKPF